MVGKSLAQLDAAGERIDAPVLSGRIPEARRRDLLDGFRTGGIKRLAASLESIARSDRPRADVVVLFSALSVPRADVTDILGMLDLRPGGPEPALFVLATKDTKDQDLAASVQSNLGQQGHGYKITLELDGA